MNTKYSVFSLATLSALGIAAISPISLSSLIEPVRAGASISMAPSSVVASGLNNPRGLSIGPDGAIYVAEAGTGGIGPCGDGPEGPRCYGPTGSITRVDLGNGATARITTGLPSLATEGMFATGVHDISFLGKGNAHMTTGFGGHPDGRSVFGPAARSLAHTVRLRGNGAWVLEQDLGFYETENNPTGDEVDTNPYGILSLPGKQVVADAGANALNQISANGIISTLAVFPDRMVDAPPFLELPPGTQIPMDTVPTSVALGPDGNYYVGQLTGFPFPVDGAYIYRVPAKGGPVEVFATGFTAVIDVAFGPDGSLYVLELAKNGLLAGFIDNDWSGAVIRLAPDGSRTEIAVSLFAPGGVTVGGDGAIYVTNNSIFSSIGEVVRIQP